MTLRAPFRCPDPEPPRSKLWRERGIAVLTERRKQRKNAPGPWYQERAPDALPTLESLAHHEWAPARVLRRSALGDTLRRQLRACMEVQLVDSYALHEEQRPALETLLKEVKACAPHVVLHVGSPPEISKSSRFNHKARRLIQKGLKGLEELLPKTTIKLYPHLTAHLHDRYLHLRYRGTTVCDTYLFGHGVRTLEPQGDPPDPLDCIAKLRDPDWDLIKEALQRAGTPAVHQVTP